MKLQELKIRTSNLTNFGEFKKIAESLDFKFNSIIAIRIPYKWQNWLLYKQMVKSEYKYRMPSRKLTKEDKISIICPIHGKFEQMIGSHIRGMGCKECGHVKMKKNLSISTDEFLSRAEKVHGKERYKYVVSTYKSLSKKLTIICPIHGEFQQTGEKHLYGQGCPTCKESKGAMKIRIYLESNRIKYKREHSFKGFKSLGAYYKYDFYLPDYNLCIEYDGEQHFRPTNFNGISKEKAVIQFNKTVENDKLKNSYCLKNKIGLIRIPYTSYNEIEKILKESL